MSAIAEAIVHRFRLMIEDDLERVLEIERDSYGFPWTRKNFLSCLQAGYCCWLMECRGQLDGYGIMAVTGNEAHILNLCIRLAVRRRGLGRTMLLNLLSVAASRRACRIILETRLSNTAALGLYRNAGFRAVRLREDYYPAAGGKREDALELSRELRRDSSLPRFRKPPAVPP